MVVDYSALTMLPGYLRNAIRNIAHYVDVLLYFLYGAQGEFRIMIAVTEAAFIPWTIPGSPDQ
jgi:hypothetical protein